MIIEGTTNITNIFYIYMRCQLFILLCIYLLCDEMFLANTLSGDIYFEMFQGP